jgi:PleD family two-component response regulator
MGVRGKLGRAEREGGKILLAGDIGRAFVDAGDISAENCEVCPNILDAIEAASKRRFAAIGVVMSGASGRLRSALKALRESCESRIILLAQMSEEPGAMRLVDSSYNGSSVADDYLICPIRFSALALRVQEFGRALSVAPSASLRPQASRRAGLPATAKWEEGVDAAAEERTMHLEKLATEDDLTGLKNRRYIWEFARQVIERAGKEDGRVTLLVFDVDNLKHYNDLYGHLAGDSILKQAAVLIRRCCRAHDAVGRIGGDEFAVVFWDDPRRESGGPRSERRSARADHPAEAIYIAKRFVRELEKAELNLLGPDGKGELAISGGLASFPRDGSTIGELFEKADRALLEAKRSGKNRIYLVGKPQNDIADIE